MTMKRVALFIYCRTSLHIEDTWTIKSLLALSIAINLIPL